jgi:hypothetical protein
MPFKLVIPVVRSSAMTGARSAVVRFARAMRALSAMLGARWPVWRPVGMAPVCQGYINASKTLSPRDVGLARVKVGAYRAVCYLPSRKGEKKHSGE